MSPHKIVYTEFFGLTDGDCPLSEISGDVGIDVHAIHGNQRGGRKEERPIEELICLTRKEHDKYGGKKQYKHALYNIHLKFIQRMRPDYNIREEYLQYIEEPEIKIE